MINFQSRTGSSWPQYNKNDIHCVSAKISSHRSCTIPSLQPPILRGQPLYVPSRGESNFSASFSLRANWILQYHPNVTQKHSTPRAMAPYRRGYLSHSPLRQNHEQNNKAYSRNRVRIPPFHSNLLFLHSKQQKFLRSQTQSKRDATHNQKHH